MSHREKGEEMFRKVYCGMLEPSEPGQDDFMDLMIENLFGQIWSREDALSVRDRRLVIMGMIAAIGDAGLFGFQAISALRNEELTPEQVRDISITATQYVGYPRAAAMRIEGDKAIAQHEAAKA